jgi:hypothetical protein
MCVCGCVLSAVLQWAWDLQVVGKDLAADFMRAFQSHAHTTVTKHDKSMPGTANGKIRVLAAHAWAAAA